MARRASPFLLLLPLGAVLSGPAAAVTQNASVNASVTRPLTLAAQQNLDLGTITLMPGTWAGVTAGISRSGLVTCGANLICAGAPTVARFKVTGSNKMVVLITAPNATLVNQADSSQKLTLTIDSPGQLTLTSSGEPGNTFNLGGSLTLSSTTAAGTYSGTLQVTVNYQ